MFVSRRAVQSLFVLLVVLGLNACATFYGEMDPPSISIEDVSAVPAESGIPRFEVVLNVVNPNKRALDIAGIAYSLEILGKELVMGVTDEVPRIEGYSEEKVTLQAGVQLVGILRLMAALGTTPSEEVDYRFSAKIDFEGFLPTQRVEETGKISLKPEDVLKES
ncbi:MAG: LEA type 2 family protein [Halioglobus sp.]|nr:LEA type 2 family protein [Halioglobus sp.]